MSVVAARPAVVALEERGIDAAPVLRAVDPSSMDLVVEPGCARLVRHAAAAAPHYDEFAMAILLVRSRRASGSAWKPERMAFQHERAHDDRELARVFGCPLVFGATEVEMRISPSVLELRHTSADSTLLAVVSRYAAPRHDAGARSAARTRVLGDARRMATELPTLTTTASAVHTPERTVQRRLAEEGVTHSSLVDDVRRNLALKYIAEANVSVTEIG